jgi:hypothetical protein
MKLLVLIRWFFDPKPSIVPVPGEKSKKGAQGGYDASGAPQSNVERAHNTAALMVSYPNNWCASENARTGMET